MSNKKIATRDGDRSQTSEAPETRLGRAVRQMIAVETGDQDAPSPNLFMAVPDIAGIRQSLGLTQVAAAQALGLPVATLRNWEQGRRAPSNVGKLALRLLTQWKQLSAQTPGEPSTVIGKQDLVRAVEHKAHLQWTEAEAAVDAIFEAIVSRSTAGSSLRILGLGTLELQRMSSRAGGAPGNAEPGGAEPSDYSGSGAKKMAI